MLPTNNIMPRDVTAAAVNAATLAAIAKARQTGTHVLVWKNGKMVAITPDQAEAEFYQDAPK